MAYGIAAAAARLARLVKGEGAVQHRARLALVLRVENVETLRAGLGPQVLEQILEHLTRRLVAETRLLPQTRGLGSAEVLGLFAVGRQQAVPGLLARLRTICSEGVDLPDLRICPVVNAVIVSDETGQAEPAVLYAHGRAALQGCDPLSVSGQMRFVELPAEGSVPDTAAALDLTRLRITFQPQICCDTGAVLGLRLQARLGLDKGESRDLHEIEPRLDDEALGQATAHALREALACLKGWDRMGARVPMLTLPLSDRSLADPLLADSLLWELDRQDLSAARLEIEIREPIGRSGGRMPVTASLQRLAAAGCTLVLGEFGTGSAGLADLRRFGIGRVRVGREFVADCHRRADQQRMILAILALAEHLRLATLADGVANPDENAFLAQIGFGAVQGPAVAPAMEAQEIDRFLLDYGQSLPAPFDLRRKV
ncbi:EAL domain, c-di-GMP-specific phosphodiesterase class I (or its enzymatically inactive variant) [Paracoccus aminovorans]|uniref:EAL domain, c-di-GMP-specific phosphodiesterase class I (Or its enzymatically inactive variant) n=1 Tax=Paracoccus aminovorans TaxID=34004 RepID=A0A1I3BMA3_9RHOB|nr:EAL domain-containing protein [Paracoccus aminovorans]CQR86865.1 diguanylate phosphodiesterase [Paracoccus aminovorans]SFH63300.1 EAL domain, c-di-GMP-specific phosphodiesterase class I (or its enzymatically inactive variant) [Paracoccus aminovorans]